VQPTALQLIKAASPTPGEPATITSELDERLEIMTVQDYSGERGNYKYAAI
jgi:hypothetical protein